MFVEVTVVKLTQEKNDAGKVFGRAAGLGHS